MIHSIAFFRLSDHGTKICIKLSFPVAEMLRIFSMYLTFASHPLRDATSKEFLWEKLGNQVCEGRTFICHHYLLHCREV